MRSVNRISLGSLKTMNKKKLFTSCFLYFDIVFGPTYSRVAYSRVVLGWTFFFFFPVKSERVCSVFSGNKRSTPEAVCAVHNRVSNRT